MCCLRAVRQGLSLSMHLCRRAEDETNRRYPKVYELDAFRCIFCGFCEEACPVRAIILRDTFELATYDNKDVFDKEKLAVRRSHEEKKFI